MSIYINIRLCVFKTYYLELFDIYACILGSLIFKNVAVNVDVG